MKWSLKIATVAGIGIYLHWTFLLIIALFVWMGAGAGAEGALRAAVMGVALFACIALHELGHALTARAFGYKTRDITLLFIGGVARLERMPDKPSQELLVAIAGPAVNVAIAIVLIAIIAIFDLGPIFPTLPAKGQQVTLTDFSIPGWLVMANLFIVAFNLLPAFPMDGGRMLRALLATRLAYDKATRIAANVGQVLAVVFFLFGLFSFNVALLLIGVVVYLGAEAEAGAAAAKAAFEGLTARDAMVTRFKSLSTHETLADASEELLAGTQQDFPVVDDAGRVAGILARADLVRALATDGMRAGVSQAMRSDCVQVDAAEPLGRALERMRGAGCPIAPVIEAGRLVGLITPDNVTEVMMLREALGRTGRDGLELLTRAP